MTKLEQLVIDEAILLKQHATKEEINKLNYKKLDGCSRYSCIYGQITGNCVSERAYELIRNCCHRVYRPTDDFSTLAGRLNGKPKVLEKPSSRLSHYVSPIENFLFKNKINEWATSEKVEKLVAFLKGESDKLEF